MHFKLKYSLLSFSSHDLIEGLSDYVNMQLVQQTDVYVVDFSSVVVIYMP